MDVLSRVLDSVTIRGSVFCHGGVSAPWRFEGGASGRCLFHCVVDGAAWLTLPSREPLRLGPGDVALLPRGGRHRMGSKARGAAVPLGEAVSKPSLDAPFARFELGGGGAESHLICGSLAVEGMDWHPLLKALPDLVVVNANVARWLSPTLAALERYLDGDEPGAELITRRLADVLFVQTIASWLRSEDVPDGWLRALTDPNIGRAIGMVHARPADPWSVDTLSRAAAMSRSAFFQRFRSTVGATPAKYLAGWRMTLAARALTESDATVPAICEQVGYASVPSFTQAFRRHHGQTPAAYRRARRAASC